ncbi:MAG: MerR family DNA-binding transcriptional regulator [Chromatocurvus sp.]
MSDKTYSISELAGELNITPRTIRFYEERGFISPGRSGQQRRYTSADRVRIKLILRGKRIGLSLAESVEIIDMYEPSGNNATQLRALIDRIAERRAQMIRQRADIDAMLESLREVDGLCRAALAEKQSVLESPPTKTRRAG